MIWRFLKAFPKYLLVLVVMVGSTLLFAWWWMIRSPERREQAVARHEEKQEQVRLTAEKVAERLEHLIVADNTLIDTSSGEVLFSNWLKDGMPLKLFIEEGGRTVLAQYEAGFVRCGLDGARLGALTLPNKFAVDDTYRWTLFSRGGDVWRADIDWKALKFINERKITSAGIFSDKHFADSFLLGTDETIVVQVANKQVRVDLATGKIEQGRYPVNDLLKRRSPDSKYLVGMDRGEFYCHEVGTNQTKTIPMGRSLVRDYQWLGNDRCILLIAGKSLAEYDRNAHSLKELVTLPGEYDQIAEPSPNRRYLLCRNRQGLVVVDTKEGKTDPAFRGTGILWIDEERLIYSNSDVNTTARGVWLVQPSTPPTRIYEEPFLVAKRGDSVIRQKSGDVVFLTSTGMARVGLANGNFRQLPWISKPERILDLSIFQ